MNGYPFGLVLTYAYDAAGNRTRMEDSFHGVTLSAYDPANRLVQRTLSGLGGSFVTVTLNWTAANQLKQVTRLQAGGEGLETDYLYDKAGHLSGLKDWVLLLDDEARPVKDATPLNQGTYVYDIAGQLVRDLYDGQSTPYSYDAIGQISSDGTTSYNYDSNGNLKDNQHVIGEGNLLQADDLFTYQYDREGDLVRKDSTVTVTWLNQTISRESWTYTYDNAHHLVEAHQNLIQNNTQTLTTVHYDYDALGRRLQDTVTQVQTTDGQNFQALPTQVTRFGYDGQDVLVDLNGADQPGLVTHYLRGDVVDQLFARSDAKGLNVFWYATDRQGSVRQLVDTQGNVRFAATYNGFGRQMTITPEHQKKPAANPVAERYQYAGREWDPALALYYNRARMLDPFTGRWTTQDPMGFAAGDTNLYRYVGNSPTNATDPTGLFAWDPLGNPTSGWFAQVSDFSAGMGDTVTGGGTAKIRQDLGYDDAVNYRSAAYRYGGYAGTTINIGLMVAGEPASLVGKGVVTGINALASASAIVDATQAWQDGNYAGASLSVVGAIAPWVRGAGEVCKQEGLGLALQRTAQVVGAGQGVWNAAGKFNDGDVIGGLLDMTQAELSAYHFMQSCFAAGTPLLTPEGDKLIEQFRVGDLILSRSDFDPEGPLEAKQVEEVFVRLGRIMTLRVGGREIQTTAEHPFWVQGQGWLPGRELKVGDQLLSHDGRWLPVAVVEDTGAYRTLYNLRIQDYHTYFVGSRGWGFSAWAHNSCVELNRDERITGGDRRTLVIGDAGFEFGAGLAEKTGLQGDRLIVSNFDAAAGEGVQADWTKRRLATEPILEQHGIEPQYDVDATQLHQDPRAQGVDNIIWNGPYREGYSAARFPPSINANRELMSAFFQSAASEVVLSPDGRIFVTVPEAFPYVHESGWDLPGLAAEHGLELERTAPFDVSDFNTSTTQYRMSNSASPGSVGSADRGVRLFVFRRTAGV